VIGSMPSRFAVSVPVGVQAQPPLLIVRGFVGFLACFS
jgi:hypothetical protein